MYNHQRTTAVPRRLEPTHASMYGQALGVVPITAEAADTTMTAKMRNPPR